MREQRGFTLTELMIVVAIIGVLGALAYPQYQNFTREARRSDAHRALLSAANEQEKFYANSNTYTRALNLLYPGDSRVTGTGNGSSMISMEGHYTVTMPAADANAFTIRAVPAAGSSQQQDSGCLQIDLNSANQQTPANCLGD